MAPAGPSGAAAAAGADAFTAPVVAASAAGAAAGTASGSGAAAAVVAVGSGADAPVSAGVPDACSCSVGVAWALAERGACAPQKDSISTSVSAVWVRILTDCMGCGLWPVGTAAVNKLRFGFGRCFGYTQLLNC